MTHSGGSTWSTLSLLLLLLQGEGEEEETDDLIGQVLDEIGISTTTQVRGSSRAGRGLGMPVVVRSVYAPAAAQGCQLAAECILLNRCMSPVLFNYLNG